MKQGTAPRKLRVLALMDQRLLPPDELPPDIDLERAEWRTEWDVVSTLKGLGHDVVKLGVQNELAPVRTAVWEQRPHIVFNLLEDFQDVPIYDQNVVTYLELLQVNYTGCNPRGLMLARDKAISKSLLAHARISVPEFAVVERGRKARLPRRMSYPVIVKSLTKEGSAGIAQSSVVDGDDKLRERVAFVHERLHTDAIVERYIDGRELYVGVLGNHRLEVLPIWEIVLDGLAADAHKIATAAVKWDAAYQERHRITTQEAAGLPEAAVRRIQHWCRRVYRILHLSGYARIDLRMDRDGEVYVLEANPNPQLARGEDFAASAAKAGIGYPELLQRIVNLGRRWDVADPAS